MPRYFCLARPPFYANYPDRPQAPTAIEVWYPEMRCVPGGGDRYALGQLDYAEPLPLDTIHHWTLWPADRKEWAELVFFKEAGGDPTEAAIIRADYVGAPLEDLRNILANGHVLAEAALVLRGEVE